MPTVTIGDNTGQTAGTTDTWLSLLNPTTNFGSTNEIQVHTWDSGDHGVGLVKFDYSSITPPVTVSAVEIGLFLNAAGGPVQTFSIFAVLLDWVELQATWNVRATATNWGTAGLGAGDISSSLQDLSMGGTIDQYYMWNSAALIAAVEARINGTAQNYGFAWKHTAVDLNANTFRTFASKGNIDGERPYCTVTYTSSGGGGSHPIRSNLRGNLVGLSGGLIAA